MNSPVLKGMHTLCMLACAHIHMYKHVCVHACVREKPVQAANVERDDEISALKAQLGQMVRRRGCSCLCVCVCVLCVCVCVCVFVSVFVSVFVFMYVHVPPA